MDWGLTAERPDQLWVADYTFVPTRTRFAYEWVTWWNHARFHQTLDYRTLHQVEAEYWHLHTVTEEQETKVNA
ncbi:hypothetical protein J2S45_000283 [Trueperella abortisuis]|uniref:Integrase catalytic domain-containing protein n=1 Tax=Trueperella abortisuis TaxID=445930 RepID=A0ABT9PFX1_9ACTO|nr:hypothetical protein [Trueperella abortisuis]